MLRTHIVVCFQPTFYCYHIAFINSANAELPGKCQSRAWLGKSIVPLFSSEPQDYSLSSMCEGHGELTMKEVCTCWALSRSPIYEIARPLAASLVNIRNRCVLWCVTSDILHRQRDAYLCPPASMYQVSWWPSVSSPLAKTDYKNDGCGDAERRVSWIKADFIIKNWGKLPSTFVSICSARIGGIDSQCVLWSK